jgi:hypothetical protein
MDSATAMTKSLLYRRQFLLARQPLAELDGWVTRRVGPYFLHAHPDLQITVVSDTIRTLTLLGYLYDPADPPADNEEILKRVFAATKDFSSLTIALKLYPGRYALFYQDRECLYVVQDALALREVYYAQRKNRVICGSQPNLLVRFAQPEIVESSDPELLDFVRHHLPRVRDGRLWGGDGTPYESVKHLLPNHYLDLTRLESRRYWPNAQLKRIEINEAVAKCATFLQGALKAAAHRHRLMLAVTAGLDSRSLLAASRDIADSVLFFVIQHGKLTEQSSDIRIPKELFARLGLPFHVLQSPKDVPEEFRRIFLENTLCARETLLPEIYNIYYKDHGDRLNILGVGEVGRTKFYDEPKNVSSYYLAYMIKHRRSSYAVRECGNWLESARPIARQYGLNIMTLFWWEVLIGTWGAVGNSESDIAIEEFDPFASHQIYELMLSVDAKYRTFKDNIFFDELIRYMWPELLEVPVNPPQGMKAWRDWALHQLGVEQAVRKLKFTFHEAWYHLWWKNRCRAI